MCTRENVNEVKLSIVEEIDLNDFCKNDARMIEIKQYGSVNLMNECYSECSDNTQTFGIEPMGMAFLLGSKN